MAKPKMGAKARAFMKKNFMEPGASIPLSKITKEDRHTIRLVGSMAKAKKEEKAKAEKKWQERVAKSKAQSKAKVKTKKK